MPCYRHQACDDGRQRLGKDRPRQQEEGNEEKGVGRRMASRKRWEIG
jgi:hypothetical protein